jgi:hypothetical protein
MNATKLLSSLLALCLLLVFAGPVHAQQVQMEPMLEVPLHPLPATMTYDDYIDANRRISMALAYVMIPGGMHFYAGESTKGWAVAGTAAAGLVCLIASGGMADEAKTQWQETKYETVDLADGQRYAKVPVGRVEKGSDVERTYKLTALERKAEGSKGKLGAIGAVALIGSYVYGIYDSIATIERKRSKARFKYGKIIAAKPRVSFAPSLHRDGAGLAMNVRF